MNSKLHERAKVLRNSFDNTPESIASLDLAAALEKTDPDLLSFLSTMTMPIKQSGRNLFETVSAQKD